MTAKESDNLRKQAEATLAPGSIDISSMSEDDISRAVQELCIYQLELEMQNEELRIAQGKLEDSQSRLADLYDYAPVGYLTVSNKGLILTANLTAAKMLGVEKKFLDQQPITALFPFEDQDSHYLCRKKLLETKEAQSCEKRLRRRDGSEFDGYCQCTIDTKIDGDRGQFRMILTDISKQKEIEREKIRLQALLRQSEKMEALGTFAGGIAHDFNNILAVILGYADIAKDDAPPGTNFQNHLEKILTAANRAKDLVKQILSFSRQALVERVPIKIQPLIKDGLKMLRSSIPSTIAVTEDIDPKCAAILADPTQIHQILMNLCSNAYHAMEQTGGTLSVILKPAFIGTDEQKILNVSPGDYVELTVSDTGVGIGPDIIPMIFDPYFTSKEVGKGTGLGLSIIHGIMTEYGGAITVDSTLGKGSTFHVYFPVVEKDTLPDITALEDLPKGEERILLIDDEELVAEMGKDMLVRLGYQVTVRLSSIEALATFQNNPDDFDLVITDQTMPEMTGSELSRRMMQIRPDIPIILCTGYSSLIDADSAKSLGIKEFVLKPLTRGVLSNLIRTVLKGKVKN